MATQAPAQTALKASTLEKIVVNAFTPLDYLFFLGCLGQGTVGGVQLGYNIFAGKISAYKRLLESLQQGYDKRVAGLYMDSLCGRIDVLLAMRRGLLSREQYEELKREY